MEIAIIAADMKKEIMTQFCIAYCGILSKHNLCATSITAKYISDATGLKIERLLTGAQGGEQQIATRVAYNEIDILLCFLNRLHLLYTLFRLSFFTNRLLLTRLFSIFLRLYRLCRSSLLLSFRSL